MSEHAVAIRDERGRFPVGQSGNPGGRSRVMAEVTKLLNDHSVDAVKTIVRLMNDGTAPAVVQASCATYVIDRLLGKAKQAVDVTVDDITRGKQMEAVLAALRESGGLSRERFSLIIQAQEADDAAEE